MNRSAKTLSNFLSIHDQINSLTPHNLIFHFKFHNSSTFFQKPQFQLNPTETLRTPPANTRSSDADKICKLLSAQPISNIRNSLTEARIVVSSPTAAEVLKNLSNAGMVALSFFRWAENQHGFAHTTEIYHNLIDALGKIKQFRLIWTLIDSMKRRGLLRKETFLLICRRYARGRKIGEAVESFGNMELFGFTPNAADYNALIDIVAKSKNAVRAEEIVRDLNRKRKFSPDLKTYTILIEGYGGEKNVKRMKEVYGEMEEQKVQPDVVTFGILLNAFFKSGNCDEALKMFNTMKEKGCKPTPHIYCTLINGLGSSNRLEEALEFFELSKTCSVPAETPTYNAVVGSYCRASRFEDAFRAVEEMRGLGVGPNARTFDIILHHMVRSGRAEEAYAVFRSMSGDCEPQLNTYTMMVGMLCAEERLDLAVRVWGEMKEKGILPCMHMFSALINGMCYENRVDEACEYFQEMLDKGIRPPGQLFSKLKETLIEGGKKDLAYTMSVKLDLLRKVPLKG